MEELRLAIQQTPIIDHHAHNLLLPSKLDAHPLLSITTEATGAALEHTTSTLAHLRAVSQLAKILGCEESWDTIKARLTEKRQLHDNTWEKFCFRGIETVLIDDGLDAETVHPYHWHDRLTRSKCKRVVRIEKVAETILVNLQKALLSGSGELRHEKYSHFVDTFLQSFRTEIEKATRDGAVAGFKSVICYRTGLALPTSVDADLARQSIYAMLDDLQNKTRFRRLSDDVLSPFLVHLTAEILTQNECKKPFQFHTGLGDNDIRLRYSCSSHLQPFIEKFPSVSIVLLHASYPFTREASYLASTYVLCEYVTLGTLTTASAITIVEDVLFSTSNKLYELGLPLTPIEIPAFCDDSVIEEAKTPHIIADYKLLKVFLAQNPNIEYLRLQWLDYTATARLRILPIQRALTMFEQGSFIGITKAVLGLLQTDVISSGFKATGQYDLYPILSSLRLAERTGHATVQCEFRDNGKPEPACPRTSLRRIVDRASSHGLTFLVGFEIEVVFMSSTIKGSTCKDGTPPITQAHCWSSASALHNTEILDLIEAIMKQLQKSEIEICQFHPESAPGQFEFVMSPLPPLAAVDALLAAKEIIGSLAAKQPLQATYLPKPFPNASGTGAHTHLSLQPPDKHQSFLAGILKHLPAIAAFTYPNEVSYERVTDSAWAGGTWVAWGTQNRETPLRYIEKSHYEVKCMDGLANPYLALSAILGAGVQGVLDAEPLVHKDCLDDPAKLSQNGRRARGIMQQLPKSFEDALTSLEKDTQLRSILDNAVYNTFTAVKKEESKMLANMEPEARRQWLIERY